MKQTVVPSGTGKGSSDIVRVIYSIRFFLFCCLVLYLYLLLLHFWQKKKNTMVYRCISECAGRSFLLAAWLTADERKHDIKMTSRMTEQHEQKTGSETESEMESIFRNFLCENSTRIIFFLMQNSTVNFKKRLVRQLYM